METCKICGEKVKKSCFSRIGRFFNCKYYRTAYTFGTLPDPEDEPNNKSDKNNSNDKLN